MILRLNHFILLPAMNTRWLLNLIAKIFAIAFINGFWYFDFFSHLH